MDKSYVLNYTFDEINHFLNTCYSTYPTTVGQMPEYDELTSNFQFTGRSGITSFALPQVQYDYVTHLFMIPQSSGGNG